jgi:hypothetical protein
VAEKTCPSCGTDVPSVAKRCKECFHDFTTAPVKRNANAPLVLLGFLSVMAVIGALTLGAITTFPLDQKIQVNGESGYIITTTQYVSGVTSERVAFSQVAAVEHVVVGNGTFEVAAIRTDGGRVLIEKAKKSRKGIAEKYAKVMGKPFTEVDNSSGFFVVDEEAAEN